MEDFMIYEINEMIDYLDQFFDSSSHETIVGGIAGTQIEKYTLDSAIKTTPFSKILVLNGCQDYIGLMKEPLNNVLFYADIMIEEIVDGFKPIDPWSPRICNPEPESMYRVNTKLLAQYDVIVIFNSHLIPSGFNEHLSHQFSGKIIHVVDPLERAYLSSFVDMPVLVDHLEKVSPMIALARSVYGFQSRAVDRKVRGTITEISKINRRSVGKIDDNQYVTNDWVLYEDVIKKQKDAPFRKNQKVLISPGSIAEGMVSVGAINDDRRHALTSRSLLVITNPSSNPLMQLRIYNSKTVCGVDVEYDNDIPYSLTKRGTIRVEPANIITPYSVKYHRFNKLILILDKPLTAGDKYSIIKNSNNITLVNNIKGPSLCSVIDSD